MAHRKSVQELKAAGTYRKDRHAGREEAGNLLTELPPPPFELTKEAKTVYQDEGQRLIEMKMLKPSDLRLLAMYATEIGVYITEMQAARKGGLVVTLNNKMTAISQHRKAAEQALKLASALGDKLGLNPTARHRLKGEAAFRDSKPETESKILQMMQGRKKQVNG